jgi:hypothetical protein
MKRIKLLAVGLLVFGLIFLGLGQALAATDPGCTALGGDDSTGECVISSAVTASGTVGIAETLHLLNGGVITIASPGLTINITGVGNGLVMEAGSMIDGGDRTCFGSYTTAWPVTINAAGNIDLKGPGPGGTPAGAIIRSNGCSGGAIVLTAAGNANIDGLVESVGTRSGTGAVQGPGGGTITIEAGCDLTISDTGVVSSRGGDPGADLIHLEACTVEIYGLVESTGKGHAVPNNPANHCNADVSAHPIGTRSKGFTGCVEVWGNTITIDATGDHNGEVNADIGGPGGNNGRGWIDLFARKSIKIIGNPDVAHPFAVHSNGGLGQNTDDGGLITVKSTEADITASGMALQADATSAGSYGGNILVQAHVNVNLNTASTYARGDFNETGGYGKGGTVNARAFTGGLTWQAGVGDVRPTGTDNVGTTLPAASRGVTTLQDCADPAGVDTTGSIFPENGLPATTPTVVADACDATKPTVPAYVTLPPASCIDECNPPATKRGVKWEDKDGNGMRDAASEPLLSGWGIRLFGTTAGGIAVDQHRITDANGAYEFVVPAGDYTVCETLQVDWEQTYPTSGEDCGVNGIGYAVYLNPGDIDEGNDFGNKKSSGPVECPEDPNAILTRTVDPSGTLHGGIPNHLTVQAAYDAASNGETIGLFSKTVENVVLGDHDGIDGDKTLKITQCTSAQVTAADSSKPVWDITSTGQLLIVGPDAVGGTIGWRVATGGHDLRGLRATGASGYGALILGSNNAVSFNSVRSSTVGIRIEGTNNDVRGGTVELNTGDGVQIGAPGTANKFRTANVQNNGGNGIVIEAGANSNTVSDNGRVNSNSLNGILVSGNNNTIKNNAAASDKLLGNGQDGFKVTGTGNTFDSNKANANAGAGFHVTNTATGTKFKSNQSNQDDPTEPKENGGAEYNLEIGATNQGGNKADNISIPKTTAPQKCPTFPAAGVCE